MKKITELVTKTEKPEHKAKRKAITFGSFKRAEDRQVAERKQKEHEAELAGIAENARIQRAVEDEHQRVIKEQNSEKRNKFVTESLTNAFKPKIKDMNTVREQAINTYLPREFIPVAKDYPEPFKDEPALNKELADFKVKINEHLQKVGFASSGGGGIGSIADANDVEDLSDGEFLQFRASDGKFIGAAASVTTLALSKLDIDGGTDIGAAIVDADLLVIDDGAGGTNRKTAASRIKTYVADVTLTTAAQTNITSVGTLTALQVDNLNINGNTLSSTAGTDLLITPLSGQQIVLDGTIIIDAGVVTGATSITSTAFVGDITGDVTGNTDTATVATTVTITDNESTNENNAIIFTAGGDLDGGNLGLESDGDLKYNPSTGTLSATNISVSGTFSTVNSVTMDANNAVIFEGSTADAHETTLTSIDATGDRTISLPNVSGTLPVLAAASATAISSTPEELNILDGATVVVGEINALDLGSTAVGTAIASKAVILDSNLDYTGIRNLTITGEIDAATGDYSGAVDVAGALTTVAITTTGVVDITDATDSSNDTGDTGALRTEGGASIAKKLFVGSAVDFSTTLQVDGVATFTGRDIHSGGITVANAGQIGSVGDADAIAIASNGVVTFTQIPVMPANSIDSDEYIDGSIDPEHLADNAVTLAKMASGTDGNIISFDSSGNPVAIATGNDGQVLTSAGAGAQPAFEDAGGGAWSLTASGTFNNTANIEISYSKTTQLILENVQIASNDGFGIAIYWATSAGFQGDNDGTVIGLATTTIADQDRAYLRPGSTGGTTGDFVNAQLTFWDPTVSGSTWMSGMLTQHATNGDPSVGFAFAANNGNHSMTKFKLAVDGTTFASGKYKILTLN